MIAVGQDFIRLGGLPMPPTSNNQYKLFKNPKTGKVRHVPSQSLMDFKHEIQAYFLSNAATRRAAINRLREWSGCRLQVRCDFYFKTTRILTLDGRSKKLDVSNRLKALHDLIAVALEIDDSLFWKISAEKNISNVEGYPTDDKECADVMIRPI